jgi:16S rRNA (guanine(966)-N(2))-methyltransferase RsmD
VAPATDATRPITDRAKQSLFDVLSPRLENSAIYDFFAGTGSMGLECLSRGSRFVTFFEADRSALDGLAKNIDSLGVKARSKSFPGDIFKWITSAPPPAQRIDIAFLDPPYRFLTEQSENLLRLASAIVKGHLSPAGIVIFRHDIADALDLPPLRPYDCRDYGNMRIELLCHENLKIES